MRKRVADAGRCVRRPDKLRVMGDARQHGHELVDQLDVGQLTAVGQLLEVMTDPIVRSLANAPVESEPISEDEAAALDEAYESIARGEGISHEEILREFWLEVVPKRFVVWSATGRSDVWAIDRKTALKTFRDYRPTM